MAAWSRPSYRCPSTSRTIEVVGAEGRRDTALKVSALDLTAMQVRVPLSASEAYGRLEIGPPKTWRRRSVPIPSALADDLAAHVRGKRPNEFVFTSSRGTPVRQSNVYARHFKPAALRAGRDPNVRFHDLRHRYAAMLIAEGAYPRAIMERLGHSSIQVTLDTYGHMFPELEADLTGRLDRVYRRVQEGSARLSLDIA